MDQKNKVDFGQPQRQSRVAILLVIFKTIKIIFRQAVFPFLIFFVLGRKSGNSFGTKIIILICVISTISMIYSIIKYYKSYFYIKGKELFITTGVLEKKMVSIPIERIQNVNFEQNIIHKIFKVKKVKIDSAGTEKQEFELAALKDEQAEELRDFLLKEKSDEKIQNEFGGEIDRIEQKENKILSLGLTDLIKAGLFENHLRSGGLIFVAMWWIYSNLQEVGVNAEDYVDDINPGVSYNITLFVTGLILFILVSVLISLIRTILGNYNLNFTRIFNGFKINKGLFNTVTISALDHKIQTLSWSDNLLKKITGIFDLKLKQASTKEVETKQSILVPGCSIEHINKAIEFLYPGQDINQMQMNKVHPSYLTRNYIISFVFSAVIIFLGFIFETNFTIYIGVGFLILLPYMSWLSYKKLSYGYNKDMILLKGGAFGDKNVLTPIYKIQSISKRQNFIQRRRGLASLVLYNASGAETIPHISETEADTIYNIFLKKVEQDQRKWM